jgi:hypothetical protein
MSKGEQSGKASENPQASNVFALSFILTIQRLDLQQRRFRKY